MIIKSQKEDMQLQTDMILGPQSMVSGERASRLVCTRPELSVVGSLTRPSRCYGGRWGHNSSFQGSGPGEAYKRAIWRREDQVSRWRGRPLYGSRLIALEGRAKGRPGTRGRGGGREGRDHLNFHCAKSDFNSVNQINVLDMGI